MPIVRNADLEVLARPSWAVSAEPLFSKACLVNGTVYEVAIWSDGTAARVAVAPGLTRWVEVSGTGQWTGPNGNNRFTDLDAEYQITVIKTPRLLSPSGTFASRDAVLIVNREDHPRIWDPETPNYTSFNVSAVANNGGLFRLTIGAHNIKANDHVYIPGNIGGLPQISGVYQISSVAATTITLAGTTFAAGYTSGGTVRDRIDLMVHKPITEPSAVGSSFATCLAYWTLSTTTRPTYVAPVGVVNQNTRYEMQDYSTAPYTAANNVPELLINTTAAVGDIATMYLPAQGLVIGNKTLMLVEGAGALQALKQAKIELHEEDVVYGSISGAIAWNLMLDPTGTDPIRRQFLSSVQSATNERYWVLFDTSQIAGATAHHIRFTRQGPAPAAQQDIRILFFGSPSGDMPASTVWGFAYEDEANKVEGRFHEMTAGSDNIGMLGGPQFVKDSTGTTEAPGYPIDPKVIADWRFQYANSNQSGSASIIIGGLDGVAEKLNLYCQLPGQIKFYFMTATGLYNDGFSGADRVWANLATDLQISNTFPSNVQQRLINTNREAPSAFQQCIPICGACHYDQGRLFVGNIKEAANEYAVGDEYFSWLRNPFRHQQVQEDEIRGGYNQLAGEAIRGFASSSAGAFGSSRVFVFSDRNLYTHGESGPFAGSGATTTELSKLYPVGPHGTLSPMSIAWGLNALFWVDQNMQLMRMSSGSLRDIGRNRVAKLLRQTPAARKRYVSGEFTNDRYMLSYTVSGGSLNTDVLVWNEQMEGIEARDGVTISAQFGQFHRYDTPSALHAQQRLFFYDSDGMLHAFDEDTATQVAIQIDTREWQFKGWDTWFVNKVLAMCTHRDSEQLSIARISRKAGTGEPWTTVLSLDEDGAQFATYLDCLDHDKTGDPRLEQDLAWYLSITGTLLPGTQIARLEFEFQESGGMAALGTSNP